eukprot:NODE_2223_length_1258_cov_65.838710_g2024_i0.p1 GENE.NODE_2223_length_1258_cov_65.838710_g2024_i0~~NODE_2223_length_1258_cov_65.838710_g2024_i0.p1  ORF type:complete len:382 (+),score=31.17 NODE_2223_length_1258_cov_65.838710_g2024_i0:58-1146(+)
MTDVTIHCIGGYGWKDKDLIGKSDPICKIQIGGQTKSTKQHKNAGTNAQWNETLYFSNVNGQMIDVTVTDSDFGKDDVLGRGSIPLSSAYGMVTVPLQPAGSVQLDVKTSGGGYSNQGGGYQQSYGGQQGGYSGGHGGGYGGGRRQNDNRCDVCRLPRGGNAPVLCPHSGDWGHPAHFGSHPQAPPFHRGGYGGGASYHPHPVQPLDRSYGPPMGQSYGPPMGQSYGPPMGQSYGPPMGQSYGPPMGQSYGPPMGQPYGPPMGQSYGPPMGQSYGPPMGQSYGPPMGQSYGPPMGQSSYWGQSYGQAYGSRSWGQHYSQNSYGGGSSAGRYSGASCGQCRNAVGTNEACGSCFGYRRRVLSY